MLKVEPIDVERFAGMAEEWNALLRASANDRFFLTWEWLHTWWRHLAGRRRLFLLAVHSDGALVALAPFALAPRQLDRLRPFRSVEFLGTGTAGSDYLDLIVRRGWEEEAVHALLAYLRRQRDMLELRQLRPDALAWRLADGLAPSGWTSRQARTDVCPFIRLTPTWDSYLATLGSAHRYNLQRRLRNLRRDHDVRFERVTAEEARGPALARLLELHGVRWRGRGRSEFTPQASFHEELSRRALARGWLRLFELRLDGRPAASLYGFHYGDTFSFFQSGLDPAFAKHSVGLVAMGLAIKTAIEDGAAEYDLLHGDEAYKFLWTRKTRELSRLELYPPLLHGLLCQRAVTMGRAARRLGGRLLPAAVADRLRERMASGG